MYHFKQNESVRANININFTVRSITHILKIKIFKRLINKRDIRRLITDKFLWRMSSCDISFRLKKIKDRNIITKLEYTVITKNVATFSLRL